MSAIIGVYYCDSRPVESQSLEKMLDILAHRGQDGVGIWQEGSIGLGHRLLWTTPESLIEKQPLISGSGNLVLTADARIDNRDELISALELSNIPNNKITDSQLILSAYEKWGEDCPNKLLGDFAFAIWDRQKQELFCARDHFGVRPFYYYYETNIGFVFASEIKALLSLSEIPRYLNEVRIADYLYPMMEDKTITSYKNIFRLPPAHTLTIGTNNELTVEPYWSLDYGSELKLGSDREYADAFREIFTEAVRCRLRSAFPIGSHLSGGLDSSSVTCVARNLLTQQGKSLHTFSNIFDEVTECDEREYIQPVLDEGGLIPHFVNADRFGPLSEWRDFFQYEDEAFIGPNHFLPWGLNRATKEAGVRVVLGGYDGDTTVSHGELYFKELAKQGDWKTFTAEAKLVSQHFDASPGALLSCYGYDYLKELAKDRRWFAFGQTVNEISKHFTVSRKNLWIKYGLKPLIPNRLRQIRQRLKGLSPHQEHCLINSDFAHVTKIKERHKSFGLPQNTSATVREDQWQSFNSGLFTFNLELIDRCASAFSIESRHPFMDKRLVEFCLALPPPQKLHQGWSRIVLRRAMAEILPPEIQWRGGKASMSANFDRGLLQLDRELLNKTVIENKNISNFINQEYLNLCYEKLTSQQKLKAEERMSIWRAATLALWLQHTEEII